MMSPTKARVTLQKSGYLKAGYTSSQLKRENSWLDRILQVHKTVDIIWSPVLFLVHNYKGKAILLEISLLP